MAEELSLLLDTHTRLWWAESPHHLSPKARDALGDPRNQVAIRVVSAWELVIREALARIEIDGGVSALVDAVLESQSIMVRDVTLPDVMRVAALPPVHQDPFDRFRLARGPRDPGQPCPPDVPISGSGAVVGTDWSRIAPEVPVCRRGSAWGARALRR